MSNTKTSSEGQMGSGESDDEFYNVKLSNTPTVFNESKNLKKGSVKKVYSPPRTKVKYDYKFDSSSDDDSDTAKDSKRERKTSDKKKKDEQPSRLPQSTSKVVEKINKELKTMKNANEGKMDKSDGGSASGSPSKSVTTSTVVPPVVVVPGPMIVPQPHLAMGPSGMLVPSAIGIGNQNVMIPSANVLNPTLIRAPSSVGGLMGIGSIQSPSNMVGVTGDLLRLQGNIVGITSGGTMPIPGNIINPQMAGLCMTGNVIPGNVMGLQGAMANQAIMSGQGNILNPSAVLTSPMINAANVMNIMNTQSGLVGNVIGNPGNMILNMNNLVGNQTNRLGFAGNVLNAAANNQQSSVGRTDMGKTKATDQGSLKSQTDKANASSKSPATFSTSDNSKNWEGANDGDDDDDDDNYDDDDDDDDGSSPKPATKEIPNTFRNDGSFMEMFKKMNEAKNKTLSNKEDLSSTEKSEPDAAAVKKPPVLLSGIVGKRRGGRVLKTGLVKKVKKLNDSEDEKGPKDAWAMYMAEVKKYREASCEEEGKTRPLVK